MDSSTIALRRQVTDIIYDTLRTQPFLPLLHPSNADEEMEKFLASDTYEPMFVYRPTEIPILDFSFFTDTSIGSELYYERIEHMQDIVGLIRHRGNDEEFKKLSLHAFPVTEVPLVKVHEEQEYGSHPITAEQVAEEMRNALATLGFTDWRVEIVKDTSSRASVLQWDKVVHVQSSATFHPEEMHNLLRHEIGVHVLRYARGAMQTEPILTVGTAKGRRIEEGVATYIEDPTGPSRIFLRHQLVQFAQQHSFREVWNFVRDKGISKPEDAWGYALRVKRGLKDTSVPGAFTKDAIYAQGFVRIQEYAANGGDMRPLLSAPIAPDEIGVLEMEVQELPEILLS